MKKVLVILLILLLTGCSSSENKTENYDYGVFLGANPEDARDMDNYSTLVIEGQLFTKEEVTKLKSAGHKVYSYINVGAIENYRPYFNEYEKYTLDVYENWEDERWIDVSAKEWQDFIINNLSKELKEKGFDGLFVDNLDVYYHYHSGENFDAITQILKAFKSYGFYVIINGGDVYVSECIDRFDETGNLFDAVNQETVFSSIIWEDSSFGTQKESETTYFKEYLSNVKQHGVDVYLLEYTVDENLKKRIIEYCHENGFSCYISSTLNLDVP